MNQQTSPHWLRLCSLGLSLCIASTTLATPPKEVAADLYAQGTALYQQERYIEARAAFVDLDLTALDRVQRQSVLSMVDEIDDELRTWPEAKLRLATAQIELSRSDLRSASGNLKAVLRLDDATPEQKAQALTLLDDIEKERKALASQVPTILDNAVIAFEDGNYADAKAGFEFVYNSSVELNLDQQKDLSRYISQIAMLESTHGSFDDGQFSAAVMQDPQDQPPAQPEPENTQESPAEEEAEDQPETGEVFNGQPETDTDNQGADLIYQAQQAQAAANLNSAQQAYANGQYNAAIVLFQKVLAVQPDNQVAQQGLQNAQTMLNQGNITPDHLQTVQLQHDALIAEFNNLMAQSRARLAESNFPGALDMASQARFRLNEGRNVLSTQEYQSLSEEALNLAEEIDRQRRAAEQGELAEQALEIRLQRLEQQRELELKRQREITERILNIRRLQVAQRYEEALLETQNLLFQDPGNPAGLALRDTIQDHLQQRRWEHINRDQAIRAMQNSNNNFEETLIPRSVIEYPDDWNAITVRRSNEFAYNDSETDRQVWNALARQRVGVDFQDRPFGQVVEWIAEVARVNVDVDWKALEDNFIDRDTPINLRLNDQVDLKVVLDRALMQLGTTPATRPDYTVRDGILTISSKERLQENPITHLYSVGDLLIDIPDFDNAPTFSLDEIIQKSNDETNPFSANRLFGEGEVDKYERGRSQRQKMLEELRQVLTTTIDSASWQINGGDTGVIQDFNSNLIITTTARNHRDISNLLGKLREIRSLQISVDSRFLVINEDFFEQVGIDLDIYFGGSDYNRASKLDPNLLPIDLFTNPFTGNTSPRAQRQYLRPFGLVDTGTVDGNGRPIFNYTSNGSLNLDRSTWSPSSIPGNSLGLARQLFNGTNFANQILSADPAFSWGITFLNDLQLDLLITATQADRRAVTLTSPKLTFFNGQRAFVQVTTSQYFVSDLQPVVGTSSAGLDPTLSPVNEGVVLDVEGTVSADRRYVTMTVLASLANILDIESTPVPIVVGGRVVDSDDPDNDILSSSGSLESPIIQISQVQTTVNVPDKGTILLGGQTLHNTVQIETGVPVLSKIPVISRFFTNRIDTVEETTLMILLRPQIIIQQENEQMLFPGLEDQVRSAGGGFGTSY